MYGGWDIKWVIVTVIYFSFLLCGTYISVRDKKYDEKPVVVWVKTIFGGLIIYYVMCVIKVSLE